MTQPGRTTIRFLTLAAALTLLCIVAAARAATLVVDAKAPRASDANPGTRALPFHTIGAAAKMVKPGDTVLVWPGLYREAVELTVSGTQDKPITLQSEVPGAAVVDGADVVTDWKAQSPGVWSFPAPDLAKNPYNSFSDASGQWVYVNGAPLANAKTQAELSPGTFWYDFAGKRIWVAPDEGQDVHAQTVEYAHRDGLIAPPHRDINTVLPLDDIHIVGFTVQHNADWYAGRRAVDGRGRRWVVEGNRVRWSSWGGISLERMKDGIIRDNLVEWCGDTGIGCGNCEGLLVEGNRVFHCNWLRIDPGFDGGFGKFVLNLDCRIRGNESAYHYGYGPWYDILNIGNVLEGNVSHDSVGGAGLMTEISGDNVFRDNVVYNVEGEGILVAESPNCVVEHNVAFNNGTGLKVRGNYTRENDYGKSPEGTSTSGYFSPGRKGFEEGMREIPDINPTRLDEYLAKYDLYWLAPKAYLSNNDLFYQNLSFDNGANLGEDRDYFHPSDIAPFVNNFSDGNIFWGKDPARTVSAGRNASLPEWQKASGRDVHSTFRDPRDPAATLPAWAEAKRALWSQAMRPLSDAQGVGLIRSPSAAEAEARLLRSPYITPVSVGDPQVKAYLFEADGQRTLGLWTTQGGVRRSLRLRLGQPRVTFEDPYDVQTPMALTNGTIGVLATYLPVYLRGVGKTITPAPVTNLKAGGFNLPGRPVPLTLTFVNGEGQAAPLQAALLAPPGYEARPAAFRRQLRPGEVYSAQALLVPVGSAPRGQAQVRLRGQIGRETLTLTAPFTVGEGNGQIPFGQTATAPIRAIGAASDFAGGDKAAWKGPQDLSGQILAAWTPQTLTVAVDVTDDSVIPAAPDAAPWDGDAVELFVDGRDPAFQYQADPGAGCFQVGVSPADPPVVRVEGKTPLTGIQATATRTKTGYRVQIRIPLSPENFPAGGFRAGRVVKMAVLLDDKDDPQARTRKDVFGWGVSPGGANYRDTSGWKTLILGNKP